MREDLVDLLWQRRLTLQQLACALSELKRLAAETRLERAMRRHGVALRIASKAGFGPDQPRVPKGNPGGGSGQEEQARQEGRALHPTGRPVVCQRYRKSGHLCRPTALQL